MHDNTFVAKIESYFKGAIIGDNSLNPAINVNIYKLN